MPSPLLPVPRGVVPHAPKEPVTTTSHTVAIGALCTGYAGLGMGAAAALGGAGLAWVAETEPDRPTCSPTRGEVRRNGPAHRSRLTA